MQYTENFSEGKIENSIGKIFIFLTFLFKTLIVDTLEPPRRDGSNEYSQSMFWIKTKKNRNTPANLSFTI